MKSEKRKYPRLSLKISDGYFGSFRVRNEDIIQAPIVNISAGGLSMATPDNVVTKIKEGDILFLQSISGGTNFKFLKDIQAQIRWIKKLKLPGYVSVGCRFMKLEEDVRGQLADFVRSERMYRGQYD